MRWKGREHTAPRACVTWYDCGDSLSRLIEETIRIFASVSQSLPISKWAEVATIFHRTPSATFMHFTSLTNFARDLKYTIFGAVSVELRSRRNRIWVFWKYRMRTDVECVNSKLHIDSGTHQFICERRVASTAHASQSGLVRSTAALRIRCHAFSPISLFALTIAAHSIRMGALWKFIERVIIGLCQWAMVDELLLAHVS